jgi:hypothetical protein
MMPVDTIVAFLVLKMNLFGTFFFMQRSLSIDMIILRTKSEALMLMLERQSKGDFLTRSQADAWHGDVCSKSCILHQTTETVTRPTFK